jgi:flagellar basal-body rod protein FlgB
MSESISFRKVFHVLENAVNITNQRHNHIASNISNIDTSDYKSKDIDFKAALVSSLKADQDVRLSKTHPGHISVGTAGENYIEPFEERGEWNGYNWVSIDKEMIRLSENNLMQRAAVETLLRKIAILKEVIREGGQ